MLSQAVHTPDAHAIPAGLIQGLEARQFATPRDVYGEYLDIFVKLTASEFGFLHLYSDEEETIYFTVWSAKMLSRFSSGLNKARKLDDAGRWADCLRERRSIYHNTYVNTDGQQGFLDGRVPCVRLMGIPIWSGGRIVALVGLGNPPSRAGTRRIEHLEKVLQDTWPVVQRLLHKQGRDRLKALDTFEGRSPRDVLRDMIGAVGNVLEMRDEYTAHHQANVAHVALCICINLELDEETQFGVGLGALIHDIGKVGVPAEILNKPGKLTPSEFLLLRDHAALGAEIFQSISTPWPIGDIICQHHERMDGSGYPNGLKGDAICFEARIIAVADAFDAMANDRPYRKALGREAAIKNIVDARTDFFDPYVVDAFIMCLEQDPTFGERYTVH